MVGRYEQITTRIESPGDVI